jgi:FAD-dependent urate hydroxylase
MGDRSYGGRHYRVTDRQASADRTDPPVSECDVAIVGAGPYGLSAAAHLGGLDVRVFGRPMSFWREHMARGMLLRSPLVASNLSSPTRELGLVQYEREHGRALTEPLPLETFIDYGNWFQQMTVPSPDQRSVRMVQRAGDRFLISLEDGEQIRAGKVVVAAGIEPFAWRPSEFSALPARIVSHSVDHADLTAFAGARVCVVGAGQSAIESAALLSEAGAQVEVIARTGTVNWLLRSSWLHRLGPVRRLLYAPSDVGPAGVSWLIQLPGLFRRIPRRVQDPLAERSIRPAAAAWLVPRVNDVSILLGRSVVSTEERGGVARLRLSDGAVHTADHVLLATGYRVDIARYGFLADSLLDGIDRVNGYPRLGPAFESSAPGLHFLGAPAAWSYGPLFRFVAGAEYASRQLARKLCRGNESSSHSHRSAGELTGIEARGR